MEIYDPKSATSYLNIDETARVAVEAFQKGDLDTMIENCGLQKKAMVLMFISSIVIFMSAIPMALLPIKPMAKKSISSGKSLFFIMPYIPKAAALLIT